MFQIRVLQAERTTCSLSTGGRQRYQLEWRNEVSQCLVAGTEHLTIVGDCLKQLLERWDQMSLVEHHQGIRPQKPSVVRPHLSRCPVTFEEEPGTDHVDGPNDDRGRGGVLKPFLVV